MNYWPCSIHREWDFWTYDNSWIVYQRLTQMDIRLVDQIPLEAVIDYHKYVVEVVEKKHAKIVHQKGWSPGGVVIEDLSGLSYAHLHKKVIEIIGTIAHIDDNYYPAILRKFIIINAPFLFTVFWNVVKKFLHPRTASKFEVLGSDSEYYQSYFKKIIPEKYIPQYLGGSSLFSMPQGGSMESIISKIPVNYRTVSIPPGEVHKHQIMISKPSVMTWRFSTKNYNIRFSVVRDGSNSNSNSGGGGGGSGSGGDSSSGDSGRHSVDRPRTSKKGKSDHFEKGKVVVVPESVVDSHKECVVGSLTIDDVKLLGCYHFVWDNSCSYWNSKELLFQVSVLPIGDEPQTIVT
eukprot:TRINITY_DN2020_c0_g2_i3.p1 TRINITY_DN2020_c0_g2~~TRINITY_DN2020_c0_g2_i3.p1  ORF type:complete len:347 (+),score=61.30 TRINITY_DN2020_c0_g2_i3:492-1532(+)